MMKKHMAILLAVVLSLTMLTGCGAKGEAFARLFSILFGGEAEETQEESMDASTADPQKESSSAEESSVPEATETEKTEASTEESSAEAPTDPEPQKAELPDPAELVSAAEEFLNSFGVNGMLELVFDDAREVSLYGVVYQLEEDFDGIDWKKTFAADGLEYYEEIGISAVRSETLDAFLKKTTGFGLAEIHSNDSFAPVYLKTADIYALQHGDTNYNPVLVKSARELGDRLYRVVYTSEMSTHFGYFLGGDRNNPDNYELAELMVCTLRFTDEGDWQLVDNEIEWDSKKSFDACVSATAFLNRGGVNGMLRTAFTDVRETSLSEVVYQMKDPDVKDTDWQALFEKNGKIYESYTGISYASEQYLDAFLQETTGFTLASFLEKCQNPAGYLADGGIYYVQHGDTNIMPVVLTQARYAGEGLVEVEYHGDPTLPMPLIYTTGAPQSEAKTVRAEGMTALLRASETGWQLVENRIAYSPELQEEDFISELTEYLNKAGVNGALYSLFNNCWDIDAHEVMKQLRDPSTEKLDLPALFKKYGAEYEADASYAAISDDFWNAFVLENFGPDAVLFEWQSAYFYDECVYALQTGGVTLHPVKVRYIDYNFDGSFTVTYEGADGDKLMAGDPFMGQAYYDTLYAIVARTEDGHWLLKGNTDICGG